MRTTKLILFPSRFVRSSCQALFAELGGAPRRRLCRAAFSALVLALIWPNSAWADVKIVLNRGEIPARFKVLGLDDSTRQSLKDATDLRKRLRVYVVDDSNPDQTPMFGHYGLTEEGPVFQPRFGLQPGLSYRATWQSANREVVDRVFRIPAAPEQPVTSIRHVFPTRDVLPENHLKFYVHFTAPMSQGDSYRYIALYGADGKRVDVPFLEVKQELWDTSGRRFTLFFDPGRVKRGLRPREELGPALESGKAYRLEIQSGWLDANGRPLAQSFVKHFRVTEPDYEQPDPARWKVQRPSAGGMDPLRLYLNEPLDHAMLHRVLSITNDAGMVIPGQISVDQEETRVTFQPQGTWRAGAYAVLMETTLEDLAGNSIGRPFEVDLFEKVERAIVRDFYKLPFRVE